VNPSHQRLYRARKYATAKLDFTPSLAKQSSTTKQKSLTAPGIFGIMTTGVSESEAAQFNRMVMRKLQKAIEADPEVDLASKLPTSYSSRLADRKEESKGRMHQRGLPDVLGSQLTESEGNGEDGIPPSKHPRREEQHLEFPMDDVRNKLVSVTSATVVFPLAKSAQALLHNDSSNISLVDGLSRLIKRSRVIWKPEIGCHKIVLDAGSEIALKIIQDMGDTTEYTTLQYLEKHLPEFPAPRPLGLVALGERYSLLFMSLMPGTTLAEAWPTFDHSLKCSVQEQLNCIFASLRSFRPSESNMPLGGIAGEGCKDLRRHVRSTKEPIWTVEEFDDWQFSNPHFGSPIYIDALRKLSPPLPTELVLSHNDLRPENVTVELEGGQCRVTGIIDWQYSGFYPTYYESTKVMNSISPNETNDWYSYIPECISAERYPQKFLLDSLWWKFVE
jgi:hypothetical protein